MMDSQFTPGVLERIGRCGVIAVLVVDKIEHAVPLAKTLVSAGIDVMELTLRTPVAIDALKKVRQEVPEMLAGIGTVLSPAQVDEVVDAGAAFAVAPGLNPSVVQRAQERGLPFAPGVFTPSDVERAIELGCRELKFFPSEAGGGMSFLKQMNAPYAHLGLRYIPLGGVNPENMGSYLSDPIIQAVGGSWLAPRDLILREDWSRIGRNAEMAAATRQTIIRQAAGK